MAIILIIIIGNLFPTFFNTLTQGIFPRYHFQTEGCEFDFDTCPNKGRDLANMKRSLEIFKLENKGYSDLKLYRTFTKNPIKFWKWHEYATSEYYQYEYMEMCAVFER